MTFTTAVLSAASTRWPFRYQVQLGPCTTSGTGPPASFGVAVMSAEQPSRTVFVALAGGFEQSELCPKIPTRISSKPDAVAGTGANEGCAVGAIVTVCVVTMTGPVGVSQPVARITS